MKAFEIFTVLWAAIKHRQGHSRSFIQTHYLESVTPSKLTRLGSLWDRARREFEGFLGKCHYSFFFLLIKFIHSIHLCSNQPCAFEPTAMEVSSWSSTWAELPPSSGVTSAWSHHLLDMWTVTWWFRQSFPPWDKPLQFIRMPFRLAFSATF